MVYLKMIAPICGLAVALIYVVFQERWWKLHDGRRVRHRRAVLTVIALLVLSTVAACIVLLKDASDSHDLQGKVETLASQNRGLAEQNRELLVKIENCQPPKRMGAIKPRYLTSPTNASIGLSRNSIHVDETRKADQQAMRVHLGDGEILQPFGPNVAFAVRKTREGLLVSARVHSLDGKVAARIIDNEWLIFEDRYLFRNFDSSAVEIIDEYGVPVLQVEFLSPDTIRLGGIFRGENARIGQTDPQFPTRRPGSGGSGYCRIQGGGMVVMGERGKIIGGKWPTTAAERDDLTTKAKKIIKPWFDYSNPDRLGVRTDTLDERDR